MVDIAWPGFEWEGGWNNFGGVIWWWLCKWVVGKGRQLLSGGRVSLWFVLVGVGAGIDDFDEFVEGDVVLIHRLYFENIIWYSYHFSPGFL